MATAAPGTIPALTPYQPGALPITGQEILEIASSTNATTAASGFMFITDVVGKAPSVMPSATPLANDLVAFFQKATGSSFSTPIGNLAVPSGNIPVAGGTGQILAKNSGANFDTGWDSISQFVLVGMGLTRSGSTAVTLSLASTAGVSVLGVAAAASAVPAAIVASGGNQFLVSNAGNTGLVFETLTTAFLPGPFQTTTLTAFGVVYGNGASPLGATAAGTSLWPLLGNGPASAPSFQQINLGSASVTGLLPVASITGVFPAANLTAANLATTGPGGIQGTLAVPHGGTSTTALTANAVVIGAGTAALQVAAPSTAGGVFMSQGSATNPAFEIIGGDLTLAANGIATVVGLYARALLSTAPATSQVLTWNGAAWAAATTVQAAGWGLVDSAAGTVSVATTNPPFGFDSAVNLQINASTAGAALTLSVVGNNGSAPSATNPVLFPFRDATLANGDPVWRSATAALSITITQSATLGGASGSPQRLWVTAHDTGTTPILGVINCMVGMPNPTQIVPLTTNTLQSTIAIGSTAFSAAVFYASAALGSRPFCILGYLEYANMTTAGQWINTPGALQLFGPMVKKPGDIVQSIYSTTSTQVSTISTTFASSSLSNSISPSSPCNVIEANGSILTAASNATTSCNLTLRRGVTVNVGIAMQVSGVTNVGGVPPLFGWDVPATTAPVVYAPYFATGQANVTCFCPVSSFSTPTGVLRLNEIMA